MVNYNPFSESWDTPYGAPPFDRMRTEHFRTAALNALADFSAEIDRIAGQSAAPTFDNTIVPLELASLPFDKVIRTLGWLSGAQSTPELRAVSKELTTPIIKTYMLAFQHPLLWKRVNTIRKQSAKLNDQQARVVEIYDETFIATGVKLKPHLRDELTTIFTRHAELADEFDNRVLAAEESFLLPLETEADMAGLPQSFIDSLRAAAAERGDNKVGVSLDLSIYETFMTYSTRRDLREKLFKARKGRAGTGTPHDTSLLIHDMIRLRRRIATIFKHKSVADYELESNVLSTAQSAKRFMGKLWPHVRKTLDREKDRLESVAARSGVDGDVQAWDWYYLSNISRRRDYGIDDIKVSEYLTLDNALGAAMGVANRLFGLSFAERHDIPVYHPDVRVWEVTDAEGACVGLYYGDFFSRTGKVGGAWMNEWRSQNGLLEDEAATPIVYNVCNFTKPAPEQTARLNPEDVVTLFHEFGHGLHGLLSDTEYPILAGTGVVRDFVETPSQFLERYALAEPVLLEFFRHPDTGRPMPPTMRRKLAAIHKIDSGVRFAEMLASSAIDMEWHANPTTAFRTIETVENDALIPLRLPSFATPRHRSNSFYHVFSSGYEACFHSYLASNFLAANLFKRFEDAGDLYDPDAAADLRDFIYSTGYSSNAKKLVTNACDGNPLSLAPLLEYYALGSGVVGTEANDNSRVIALPLPRAATRAPRHRRPFFIKPVI